MEHIPGTIGGFADTKIKTSKSLLTRILERRARINTKWRGETKRGGGYASEVAPPVMWRGTTKQTAGINPFVLGNTVPRIGAPVGVHYDTNEPMGCDPLFWFLGGMIGNPSCAWMSNPAAGKSTAMRVMMTGLASRGVTNMVIGDNKYEHGEPIKKLGGKSLTIAPGLGVLNVLDPGNIHEALQLVDHYPGISDEKRAALRARIVNHLHQQRHDLVVTLLETHRGAPLSSVEFEVVGNSLVYMFEESPHRVPILEDLLGLINNPPAEIKDLTNWLKDENRYQDRVDALVTDLASLCRSRTMGAMFNGQTTVDMSDYEKGLVFDTSQINANQPKLISAAYLATWFVAFTIIEVDHLLADYGVKPRGQFMAWLDEFWRPLSASKGIVDRVNGLTRLNRTTGVGVAYAIHTTDDLNNVADPEDRAKAAGILRRCGMQWFGGLPHEEVMKISETVTRLRDSEIEQLVEWYNPEFEEAGGWIPGRGCFLIKLGERAGIPVRVTLTQTEIDHKFHETSARLIDAA